MTGSWTSRPALNIARGGLTSATAGGRIYAIGGHTTGFAEQLDSVEVLHPGSDAWTLAPPMLTRRGNASAAAVGDRIYVFGGFVDPDNGTNTVERFDASAGTWERVADLPEVTTGAGVAALGGRIYVAGGAESDNSLVRVYDPAADRFDQAPPMPTGRELLKATVLGGLLYAIGGLNADQQASATVERYDPQQKTWQTVAPLGTPRGNPGVVSHGGRIFVVGGAGGGPGPARFAVDSAEVYEPNTNTWQPLDARLPVGRASLSAERGTGDVILAIGGFEPHPPSFAASARVEDLKISPH